MLSLLIAVLSLAAPLPTDPELRAAAMALQTGRTFDVLPHLERARLHALTASERVQAYELEAITHAAFGRTAESTQAFRRALGLDPTYRGPMGASPKVQTLFAAAQRQGALRPPRRCLSPSPLCRAGFHSRYRDGAPRSPLRAFEAPPSP